MPRCPICKKRDMQHSFRPFCSKRCSDIDLAKWMNNSYVVPEDPDDGYGSQTDLKAMKPLPYENNN